MPLFLGLQEIAVYARLYRDDALGDTDPWVTRFMVGRGERIEGGVPYVELDLG